MKKRTIVFSNLKNFSIVSTFFALWISTYFNVSSEDLLGYFLILSIGLLHGSNDLKIIVQTSNKLKGFGFFKLLSGYIFIVTLVGISFYFIPAFALLIFILISAYHFGEQHWNTLFWKKNIFVNIFFVSYGLMILFGIFMFNDQLTSEIIFNLTNIKLSQIHFKWVLYLTMLSTFINSVLLYNKKFFDCNIPVELFLLLVFAVVFYKSTLIWSFAIYFILWHSLPSILDQTKQLYGCISKENVLRYVKSSFLYWFVSVSGLSALFYLLKDDFIFFNSVFFSLLAAITFPHVMVMRIFYNTK
jgi:Brp/Blh family beta-carotene 15,15'-monooxygenase